MRTILSIFLLAIMLPLSAIDSKAGQKKITYSSYPSITPDNEHLVFSWNGSLWKSSISGGKAIQLTTNYSHDFNCHISPDGKKVAFQSYRDGYAHIYVMDIQGGPARKVAHHSAGNTLEGWHGNKQLLITIYRDFHGLKRNGRLAILNLNKREAAQVLFDADTKGGSKLLGDERILFTRETSDNNRQGYIGTQSQQIWLHQKGEYTALLKKKFECRDPIWSPDGKGFFFTSGEKGAANLCYYDLAKKSYRHITEQKEYNVSYLNISADGTGVSFTLGPDTYIWFRNEDKPRKLQIYHLDDDLSDDKRPTTLKSADSFDFTKDSLELAFSSVGDLFVMDSVLKEPVLVSKHSGWEKEPIFSPDMNSIYFIREDGRFQLIMRATRKDEKAWWWKNTEFIFEEVYRSEVSLSNLQLSPKQTSLVFDNGNSDTYMLDLKTKSAKRIYDGWGYTSVKISPDEKWMSFGTQNSDYNFDIHIAPIGQQDKAFNLTSHPSFNIYHAWSDDGKYIAVLSGRKGRYSQSGMTPLIYFLNREDFEKSTRAELLKKAEEAMKKARKTAKVKAPKKKLSPEEQAKADKASKLALVAKAKLDAEAAKAKKIADAKLKNQPLSIDFEGLQKRFVIIPIKGKASSINWIKGKLYINIDKVLHSIIPSKKPKTVATSIKDFSVNGTVHGRLIGDIKGVPAWTDLKKTQQYPFKKLHYTSERKIKQAMFNKSWHLIYEDFYDADFNNRDWLAIYQKYAPQVKYIRYNVEFDRLMNSMLGELNASHMGFRSKTRIAAQKRPDLETAHTGLVFEMMQQQKEDLKIAKVIAKGPFDVERFSVKAGQTVVSINGQKVTPATDLTSVLNGAVGRDLTLRIRDEQGEEKDHLIQGISYSSATDLLYEQHVSDTRKEVTKASKGRLGYLHVASMLDKDFERFQEEIYAEGLNKDGLIIDVRENGGGSITDHLLTSLTQPRHALTKSRGGSLGYPGDRTVYTTFHKPIIVLCNQNSFSNAEVFSHAIKVIGRGKLVGVATAGGVISTGQATIYGRATQRTPGRGWYILSSGEDQEENGAKPDILIWPKPGDYEQGNDEQLKKAIEVLSKEAAEFRAKEETFSKKLRKASERRKSAVH